MVTLVTLVTSTLGGSVSRYKVCTYDKRYYCHACFGSCEVVIPSKLLFNWDFNKYKGDNYRFTHSYQIPNVLGIDCCFSRRIYVL